ncbi:MAG: beta-lactamase family protein [Dehalococcoidales bacterium]|nr:beta-lactamase family protein [Dehalococcoidales bacterium]
MTENRNVSSEITIEEPESVGFSSERLSRIGEAMQRRIDGRTIPGIVTMVARHGKVIHFEARGLMDIEADKPMKKDTIFRLASMTKPIACVALMMLYEEGHFLLDQPISICLPSYKDMYVRGKHDFPEPARREITFLDCLTHTTGFSAQEWNKIRYPDGPKEPVPLVPGTKETANEAAIDGTLAEKVELYSRALLNYHPGTDWEYHPGHEVIGVLIEKISGQSLDRFLEERIFKPLKMADTSFYLPPDKLERFAAAYTVNRNEWGNLGLIDSPRTSARVIGPKTYFSSGGGLLSTAIDYSRFAQMLLNGGSLDGVTIIGRKTLELMTVNHTGDLFIYPMGPGYGYGLGVCVKTNLADALLPGSIGTYGWDGAYNTSFFVDPEEDLFGMMFTQVTSNEFLTNLRKDFNRLVYQALR